VVPSTPVELGYANRVDESVEGVTLLSGFLFDVLEEFHEMRGVCAPAFAMVTDLDPMATDTWVPMQLYNELCAWLEANIGRATVRRAGEAIGRRAFAAIVEAGKLEDPTPLAMMKSLRWAASTMIRDPKERGWEIVAAEEHKITMRRTQTFNCVLQEGLLLSLVEKCGVVMPSVVHRRCTREGDSFCEYDLTWLSPQ
jgi:hypothetical protein